VRSVPDCVGFLDNFGNRDIKNEVTPLGLALSQMLCVRQEMKEQVIGDVGQFPQILARSPHTPERTLTERDARIRVSHNAQWS